MKTGLTLCLLLGVLATAHAQVFRPHAIHGRAGWRHHGHGYHHGWVARPSVAFYYSDYGWGARPWTYGYASYPVYATSSYVSPTRASSGLFWGGLLGAIIGNNSGSLGHNAWRGAAYGAAAGYVLGAIGDSRARADETTRAPVAANYSSTTETVVNSPGAAATESAAVSAPAKSASPMSSANALFGR